jgi:hypothetical protein
MHTHIDQPTIHHTALNIAVHTPRQYTIPQKHTHTDRHKTHTSTAAAHSACCQPSICLQTKPATGMQAAPDRAPA